MNQKISAVYQIINSITGDCYVGSSNDVERRWRHHKCPSSWKRQSNSLLYQDMQKYGVDKFQFQILAPVMPECLIQVEQELIEMLHPKYNSMNAKGLDVEREKETHRKASRKFQKKYQNQLCSYNGETLTLNALAKRFYRAGIPHPTLEAKKFLLQDTENK